MTADVTPRPPQKCGRDRSPVATGVPIPSRAPVLANADDAHWLDGASAEALGFCARRLGDEGVVVVIAVREGEGLGFEDLGVPELRLSGLSRQVSAALLRARARGPVADHVADRIHVATAGNPLAICELGERLTLEQLAGSEPLDDPLPVGRDVERAFRRRIASLPAATQRALVVAAANENGAVNEIAAALSALGVELRALEAAEAAGLLSIDRGALQFRHPLLRSASYHGAPATQRRAAHRALAEALPAGSRGRRSWHLAAAALAPDEAVARELEQTALEARARGAPVASATAFETAARLSARVEDRVRRLVAAAADAQFAGRPQQALQLLERAAPDVEDPVLRADMQHLRARAELLRRPSRAVRELLLSEVSRIEAVDVTRAAMMLMDAANISAAAGEPRLGLDLARRAYALAERSGGPVVQAAAVTLGGLLVICGESRAGWQLLSDTEAALSAQDLASPLIAVYAQCCIWAEQYGRARDALERLISAARAASAMSALPFALASLAELDFLTGDWPAAYAAAVESVGVAEATDQPVELANSLARLARIEAAHGWADQCRAHAEHANDRAAALGADSIKVLAGDAIGLLELGLGRLADAVRALEPVRRLAVERGLGEPSVSPWARDLAEAYIRADQHPAAEETLAVLVEQAERTGRRGASAAVARCRGLLAATPDFEEHFCRALQWHAELPVPFERARTELCFGERLRRARRRTEARRPLRAALETFEELGAGPWAERARRELAATGERGRPRREPNTGRLTGQELQVALRVADGATNREAAAALFVTPKTIESHLRSVYRKLGVRSRTELAKVLRQGADQSSDTRAAGTATFQGFA